MKPWEKIKRGVACLLSAVLLCGLAGLTACGAEGASEDNVVTVYLSNPGHLADYAPYIQERVPGVEIHFTVGGSTIDFYEFMQANGDLPDVFMVSSLALRDSMDLNDNLLDLSTTETAAGYHTSYLERYRSQDGGIRWLPVGGVLHGILANQDLFDRYGIPLPTDYPSFVAACDAFAQQGIRGFVSDYIYDDTCLYTLEGWSIPRLMALPGTTWRYDYVNGVTDELDEELWTGVFARTEQLIHDVGLLPEDTRRGFTNNVTDFVQEEIAMLRGTAADVKTYSEVGTMVLLPYFGQTEAENWLMTEPAFHVALNGKLAENPEKRSAALEVLDVMLSPEAIDILEEDHLYIHPYNQTTAPEMPDSLQNLMPLLEANHMYIAQTSRALFDAAEVSVQGMLLGEYDARQAYDAASEALAASLNRPPDEPVLEMEHAYSAEFEPEGGSPAASAVANTMRVIAGTDVFLAPCTLCSGPIYACAYTEEQLGTAIQASDNRLYTCLNMTGAEIRSLTRLAVEGCGHENDTNPFSPETLPVSSGMELTVRAEADGSYRLEDITVNGEPLDDRAVYSFGTADMPLLAHHWIERALGDGGFQRFTSSGEVYARTLWVDYLLAGNPLEKPTLYITLNDAG